ncbi:hypothetical protein FRB93_004546 [Tulasnella sp. JGI-2019a]|nr:hypothetical protein FRB93_004546 [Tulasnella sp. JGI-2019a]
MICAPLLSVVLLALGSVSSPIPHKRQAATPAITDAQILNYALTLEYLEENFYAGALAKFDAAAFAADGFPPWVRLRYEQIYAHEQIHVAFISSALGSSATKPCNYTFPYTDPRSFVALSKILEGVGVSAYLGAAASITNKAYLRAAGAIASTESRHAAWISSAVEQGPAWSGPLDVPLDFDQAYSLASQFIVFCPTSNPALPVKAFPTLKFSPPAPTPGSKVTVKFNGNSVGNYVVLLTGLSQIAIPISNQTITIPANLTGTVYAVVTNSSSMVSDDSTLAGPAVLIFPDPYV